MADLRAMSVSELWAEKDLLYERYCATSPDQEAERAELMTRAQKVIGLLGDRQRDFEQDLARLLGDQIRNDRGFAADVYRALCNTRWQYKDGSRFECTWRYAGSLIARIRGRGEDYLDFYPCGHEGTVTDKIRGHLAAGGWSAAEQQPGPSQETGC